MNEKEFNEMDQKMMDASQKERDRKVPWEILNGFSASVERRILETQERRTLGWFPARAWVPVAVPVFAVLVLAVVVTLRLPADPAGVPGAPSAALSAAPSVELAHVAEPVEGDDIEILRGLGEGTEADGLALAEVEYS